MTYRIKLGKGANKDPKIKLMRQATSRVINGNRTVGGREKTKFKTKAITLPKFNLPEIDD